MPPVSETNVHTYCKNSIHFYCAYNTYIVLTITILVFCMRFEEKEERGTVQFMTRSDIQLRKLLRLYIRG